MPEIPWSKIIRSHQYHLLAAIVPEISAHPPDELMSKLLKGMGIRGEYAIRMTGRMPEGQPGTVQCAFQRKIEADRLANILRATPSSPSGEWASERAFVLDVIWQQVFADSVGDE